MKQWLCVISAKLRSDRMGNASKNFAPMGKMLGIERVISAVVDADFYDDIILFTDNVGYTPVDASVKVVYETLDIADWHHDDKLQAMLDKLPDKYQYVTFVLGCNVFLPPDWLRQAKEILEKGYDVHDNSPITGVLSRLEGMVSFNIGHFPSRTVILRNRGIYLDIDYPPDLKVAQAIWERIDAGDFKYPYYVESFNYDMNRMGIAFR